jgi:cysteine-rich repeat protein
VGLSIKCFEKKRAKGLVCAALGLFALSCSDGIFGGESKNSDAGPCDGENNNPDCETNVPPGCGDGTLTSDEECDDGNSDNLDACVNCKIVSCGDGAVFGFQEQCDDGNTDNGDGCSANCTYEDCGDGELQEIEQCEGAGSSECDTTCATIGSSQCDPATCTLAACVPPTETCNAIDDDCDTSIDTETCLVQIHRFYNESTIDHLYQADLTPPPGFVLEGQSFWVYTTEVPGTRALYQKRSANGGNHLLTVGADEANQLGYTLESTLGYVVDAANPSFDAASKPAAVYCRYFNGNVIDHMVELEAFASALASFGYTKENCFIRIWDHQR